MVEPVADIFHVATSFLIDFSSSQKIDRDLHPVQYSRERESHAKRVT